MGEDNNQVDVSQFSYLSTIMERHAVPSTYPNQGNFANQVIQLSHVKSKRN